MFKRVYDYYVLGPLGQLEVLDEAFGRGQFSGHVELRVQSSGSGLAPIRGLEFMA